MESGRLADLLGVDSNLTKQQESSLTRLEDKWMSGMEGHFNAAVEERKPLMINFDDDDNLVSTEVAALTIVSNGFDGGEEIRLEYPAQGTEFYCYNEILQLAGSVDAVQRIQHVQSPMLSIVPVNWFMPI